MNDKPKCSSNIKLSNLELKKINNWLSGLALGLSYDMVNNQVTTMGKQSMSQVQVIKDNHGIYAILGNCSLKLRES